ncbi:MAG: polysaccharide deacetylase family protein [Alteromonas sp.]|jgi:peptidoglycan/xylan/chitin deacetylase (PgdA/CDA1 family)|uniref:polysaccharide deacetylase family protein n=1 Tax=Alteromonas sp. TaxID=232 RepID=UPI0032D96072
MLITLNRERKSSFAALGGLRASIALFTLLSFHCVFASAYSPTDSTASETKTEQSTSAIKDSSVKESPPEKAASSTQMTNAAILLYHHVSTQTPSSTSVTPDTFTSHMEYIANNHTVLPLTDIVNAIVEGKPLPKDAVAITFDDGYANILENAHPILMKLDFSYTVFINPNEIGVAPQQLTWEEVKRMQREGVIFANHTLDHLHMLNDEFTDENWLERVFENVEAAEKKIDSELGVSLKYLAYPFGEYNLALATKLEENGYVGFGQHSGAVGETSNLLALPRFPAAGPYANLKTLKTKLNSLAMPVVHTTHAEPRVRSNTLSDTITLTVDEEDVSLKQVNCFYSGNNIKTHVDGEKVSFTIESPLPVGRSRVNCTAPSKTMAGRFYWYSMPFFLANDNGRYPD